MSGSIVITNARILTLAGDRPKRGPTSADVGVIESGSVHIEDGRIAHVEHGALDAPGARVIDARGRVVMPGFVDAHTHACWAGDRLDEWEQKLRGATYLEILESGGGIMSTVRSVRGASEYELTESLLARLNTMLREGTTSVEVKSGYGLSTEDELKMLRAIERAGAAWKGRLSPTACIGHAKDPEREGFVEYTIKDTLQAVHDRFPGVTIDAYCEQGAWSVDETVRLFESAKALGHPLRIHADQFNALGMLERAIELGALSVDHLEATTPESLQRLAQSNTIGVMLPCSGFHVDGRYGDGRSFIDAGGALVIATNANPGSAPCLSVPMSIALATRHMGISAHEAIIASTCNGAALLGFDDTGSIEAGKHADLVMLRHRDERQLGYEFGGAHCDLVMVGGEIVVDSAS